MSAGNLVTAMKAAEKEEVVDPNKKTFSVMVRFDLTDERQKVIAQNFREIKKATKESDNFVAIELIESGIEVLNNEIKQ